jgi:predicted nucleic acid-binding Zn ribbon protein
MGVGTAIATAAGGLFNFLGKVIPERSGIRPGHEIIQESEQRRQQTLFLIVGVISLIVIIWVIRQ